MVSNWDDADESTQVFDSERTDGVASGAERWYISADGKSKEVLAAREIIERARAGSLSDSTLVWRDGLSDWTRLDSVPELMQAVRAFRQSSPAGAPIEGHPQSGVAAGASLPPLPPVPGVQRATIPSQAPPSSAAPLPPVPAVPGAPRAVTQTLAGAPLPPPPSLPPMPSLPGRGSSNPASTKERPSSNRGSSLAAAAAQAAEVTSARASNFAKLAAEYAEREYQLPKLGAVKGKVIAIAAAGLLGVLLLGFLAFGGGSEHEPDAEELATTTRAGEQTADSSHRPEDSQSASGSNRSEDPADDSPSDDSKAQNEVVGENVKREPDVVSLDDLKSADGEPPVDVEAQSKGASGSTSRSSGATGRSSSKTRGKEFDISAAKTALAAAAKKAARCKQGPRGTGSVRVNIAPSGKVVSVGLMTKEFQGTAAGSCVQQVFRQATVPSFSGETKTVFKKSTIN